MRATFSLNGLSKIIKQLEVRINKNLLLSLMTSNFEKRKVKANKENIVFD